MNLNQVLEQFEDLKGRHPGLWPFAPRVLISVLLFVALSVLAWFFYWKPQLESLDQGQQQEQQLRGEYQQKIIKAVNLEALKKQKQLVLQYVAALEKQLPSKAEMDALLSDINQAGVGRGLQFELFKPGQVVVKDYYAELPIDIKVVGGYHDIAAFTSDIAALPRIVTLNNLGISIDKTGLLTLEAVAKTFRYLDQEEIAAQQAAQNAAQKGAK